ncbi:MAG: FtsX-like permease family protein, partial [Chitinophagaceae bacterium]
MWDGLQEIYFTLKQNKLRTFLTAFGVFWGIFMLIILLGAGKGMQNGVMEEFGSDVLDFIIIFPGSTSVAYKGLGLGRNIELTQADAQALERQLKGARFIASENSMGNGLITYGNKSGNFEISGIPDDYFKIKEDVPFNFGRKLNLFDINQIRKTVVIGTVVAERLFGKGVDPVGKDIRVKNVVMKVTGIFYDKGNRGRNSERVYIPQTTYSKTFGGGNKINRIWLRPAQGVDGFELEKKAVAILKERHKVAPDDKRGLSSFNMAEPAKSINGLFFGIKAFIWFVGMGTLMAGIVGISNIMIITVKERTREIGIRKALGARPSSIVSTLLLESILVTSVAGYLGLVLGVSLLELISFGLRSAGANLPFFKNPEVNLQVALTSIVLLVVVGALAG